MTTVFRVSILKKNYYYLDFLEKTFRIQILANYQVCCCPDCPPYQPSPFSQKKTQIMFRCKYLPQIKKGKACLKNSLRNNKFVCMTSTKYFSPWGYISKNDQIEKKQSLFS